MKDCTPLLPGFKKCSKCGAVLPATAEYFHRHASEKDGLRSTCKACGIVLSAEWRSAHREQSLQSIANWRHENPEKRAVYRKEYRERHSQKISVYNKQYYAKYPERVQARNAVSYAIQRGDMRPASDFPCARNGDRCRGQASQYHHYKGYAPENHFDVIPVCAVCHKALEKIKGAQ